ncbi:hypothetical protein [Flaviaesturariibacter amylovorans]|uniref:Uncharacterized protein n=1 Tax=Flaviaesturariibacter amylovorans TaxID=1084520 RepID=A0ABP8HU17_9BACT
MRTVPYRWLNAVLLLALMGALYLISFYKEEDVQGFYHQQALRTASAEHSGSITAR